MPRYVVSHVYAAYRDGVHYGPWTPGETVELEAELAEWVNRDSPDTLKPADDPTPVEREATPKPNRQAKSPKTR